MESQFPPTLVPTIHDIDYFGDSKNIADSISSSNPNYNAKVFWSVNAFILFLIFLTGLWCCFVQRYLFDGTDRQLASDQFYQARRRRQREGEAQKNAESPEKRQAKLLESFSRHKVQMTVEEGDLVKEGDNKSVAESDGVGETERETNSSESESDVEMGQQNSSWSFDIEEAGQLKLRTGKLVPNCCAVCLCDYRPGDVVVWSSNPECVHAFHRECVVDWLVKMQPETPCPCCRQEFTDLEEIRKENKIRWGSTFAFNPSAVRFW